MQEVQTLPESEATPSAAKPWIGYREVARRLDLSERRVHQLTDKHELVRAYLVGRVNSVGVTKSSYNRFISK
jgi:hypothetical protein